MAHFSFFAPPDDTLTLGVIWDERGNSVLSVILVQFKNHPVLANSLSSRLTTSLWDTLLQQQREHRLSPSPGSPGLLVSVLRHRIAFGEIRLLYLGLLLSSANQTEAYFTGLYLPECSALKGNSDCALYGILSPINTAAKLCFGKGCSVPMVELLIPGCQADPAAMPRTWGNVLAPSCQRPRRNRRQTGVAKGRIEVSVYVKDMRSGVSRLEDMASSDIQLWQSVSFFYFSGAHKKTSCDSDFLRGPAVIRFDFE